MFKMFTTDIVRKIIASLQKMRKNSTSKQTQTRKLFSRIKIWACESNIPEIEHLSGYLIQQLDKMDDCQVKDEHITCLNSLIDAFRNFSQFDDRLRKLQKQKSLLEQKEAILMKKKLNGGQICNSKLNCLTIEKQKCQLKISEYAREIEISKTILFKSLMGRLVNVLLVENEREKIKLTQIQLSIRQLSDMIDSEVSDGKHDGSKGIFPDLNDMMFGGCGDRSTRISSSPPPRYSQCYREHLK